MYKAFGWKDTMPQFAHLPLILKPDGKGKLSKRDGDKGGFPVFPLEWTDPDTCEKSAGYREAGYFPEACLNILAFLGWNPGTEQELFTLEELIAVFELKKTQKAGAKFDPDKARWYNHQYLLKKSEEEITSLFIPYLKEKGIEADPGFVANVVRLVKERADFVKDIWEHGGFFFTAPEEYDPKMVKKRWNENSPRILTDLLNILENITPFMPAEIESALKRWMEEQNISPGELMPLLRLSVVGTSKGPAVFDIAAVLGLEEVKKRVNNAVSKIESI